MYKKEMTPSDAKLLEKIVAILDMSENKVDLISEIVSLVATEREKAWNEALEKAASSVKGSPWISNEYYTDTILALRDSSYKSRPNKESSEGGK